MNDEHIIVIKTTPFSKENDQRLGTRGKKQKRIKNLIYKRATSIVLLASSSLLAPNSILATVVKTAPYHFESFSYPPLPHSELQMSFLLWIDHKTFMLKRYDETYLCVAFFPRNLFRKNQKSYIKNDASLQPLSISDLFLRGRSNFNLLPLRISC
jgi:hypothetical protein